MSIKIKHKDPKPTDFGPNDIVINVKEGTIFYKSEKGIFKLQGDNLNSPDDLIDFGETSISATKGFFKSPGLNNLKIQGRGIHTFRVGPQPTLEVKGHIIPSASSQPRHDLGSLENPWRDIYVSPNSFFFVKQRAGVGGSRIGSTFIVGRYRKETIIETEVLSQENVTDLKAGRSISGSGDLRILGNISASGTYFGNGSGLTNITATVGDIDGGSF